MTKTTKDLGINVNILVTKETEKALGAINGSAWQKGKSGVFPLKTPKEMYEGEFYGLPKFVVWFPKSQVEILEEKRQYPGKLLSIEIPLWLLHEKFRVWRKVE